MEEATPSQMSIDESVDEQQVRVTHVDCGSSHSLALLSNDMVLAWGRGEDGQLGHGDANDRSGPEAIQALLGKGISSVHCGAEYTLAVAAQQKQTYSWGWGDFGRLGHGTCSDYFLPNPIKGLAGMEITQVACGDTHTIALSSNGKLYAFGRNQNGQLGLGSSTDSLSPTVVESLQHQRVISVACGAEHTLAATDTGELFAWGWGRYGNLGDGEKTDRHLPTHVKLIGDKMIRQVSCGWRHSAAVTTDGVVYTFGWSKYGQLGHGSYEDLAIPKIVEALSGVHIMMLSGGWRHAAAADKDGRMFGWGWNKFGQVGVGEKVECVPTPRLIKALDNDKVRQFACGWRHTLAITEQGQFYSWGRGVSGQLGHEQVIDLTSPKLLPALSITTLDLDALQKPSSPQQHYVPAADRYAVVPDRSSSDSHMFVPQMPSGGAPYDNRQKQ